MTTLRTAAQQALEALELAQTDVHWELNSPTRKFLRKAEKTLRAALAQQEGGGGNLPPPLQAEPVQEPVAWRHKGAGHFTVNPLVSKFSEWAPLYTTPPQRKPLSLTDLQEALVLTNLIDRDAIDKPEEYDEGSTLAQIDELHRIIKE